MLARRFLTHLRAAAFAAGGSLLGLAVAAGIHRWVSPDEEWVYLWPAVSLVSVAVAVRFGHPARPRRVAELLGRVLTATVLGAALVVATIAAIVARWPHGPEVAAIAFLAVLGVGLVLIAELTMPPRRHAWDDPNAPVRAPEIEPPPSAPAPPRPVDPPPYTLAASVPPLTPEESERDALAVELRLLWGEQLVRVEHLDPPRSFHAGETACDLALGRELLGADRVTLVLAEGNEVRAVVPRGMRAAVQDSDGTVASIDGAGEGTPVLLSPGKRVTLTLLETSQTPVVVEIALVRAGRVVGRGLPLGGAGRLVASSLFAAAAALGALGYASMQPAPIGADAGEVSEEQMYEMVHHFQAVAEREFERRQELEEQHPDERRAGGEEGGTGPPIVRPWSSSHYVREYDPRFDPYALDGGPQGGRFWRDAFPGMDQMFCAAMTEAEGWGPERSWTELYCASPVATPFGLRALGTPPGVDALGRDAADLWPFLYPRAEGAVYAARPGAVRLEAPKVSGRLEPEVVRRILRQNLGRLRLCHAAGLERNPSLKGQVTVRMVIGADGALSWWGGGGSDVFDSHVTSCLTEAFRGLRFPAPERGSVFVSQRMILGPSP